MKRFLVFAGDHYYPRGGVDDYFGDYDSEPEVIAIANCSAHEWSQVFDSVTEIVRQFSTNVESNNMKEVCPINVFKCHKEIQ